MRPYKTLIGPQEPQMGPAVCGGSNGGPLEALGIGRHDWALKGLDSASGGSNGVFRGLD